MAAVVGFRKTVTMVFAKLSTNPHREVFIQATSNGRGNDYDKSFSIEANGKKHVFDSFECAIQALAPECSHCHCRIIGHGVEGRGLPPRNALTPKRMVSGKDGRIEELNSD